MAQQDRLARVRNRREFMDRLYHMNDPPKRRKTGEKTRGRLTELETSLIHINYTMVTNSLNLSDIPEFSIQGALQC